VVEVTARRWWDQGDQFDWLTVYTSELGLHTRWRAATFIFTMTLAAIPIALIASPTGPDRPVTIWVSVAAGLCAAAAALLWLVRWPTRRQSVCFALVSTGIIAATCLSQSSPYAALMGGTTFAVIGGFVGYFHTVALVAVNLAVALTCAVIATCRLVLSTGDIALAASAFLIVLGLNVGVPFGIHSLAHALRRDLRNSGHDVLTGLLNRQSFYHSTYELLMHGRGRAEANLTIVLIDVDDFKRVNDTHGHHTGDRALVAVGAALRETCQATAVIGRLGGEEFVIADSSTTPVPAALAEQLRCAIAALPYRITASIGTASVPMTDTTATEQLNELIDNVVQAADAAMYTAKRAGGNRICHHTEPAPQEASGPGKDH
jgi:diguanylate cyclase (GGDEF)-like protein